MRIPDQQTKPSFGLWMLLIACSLIVLCALFPAKRPPGVVARRAFTNLVTESSGLVSRQVEGPARVLPPSREVQPPASEIVAAKLAQFAGSRRALAQALARRHNLHVPPEAERFFDAVASGNWDRIKTAFDAINGGDDSAGHAEARPPEVQAIWPAIIDAYGAAEQVHEWPAQKLLDYGNTLIGALKPGMVYVGGTDNGRWIPELLNETSDGERHVVITQNGLADGSYLDYLRLQYDDRLTNLSEEDSQKAFQGYIDDARKRFEHDQQFPDESKQVRPGEDIQMIDGKTQVGGQVAVMAINERLLQMLMDKNPGLSFALQESFPLKATYPGALPLGPLMELRASSGPDAFSADVASQSAAYWQSAAEQVLADPEALDSPAAMKSWSHDVNSAANLLAAHNYNAEAEQTFRLSMELWPGNPEPVMGLAGLMAQAGRTDEARALLQNFYRQVPDQQKQLEEAGVWHVIMGK